MVEICLKLNEILPKKVKNETGNVYTRLTVLSYAGLRTYASGYPTAFWNCVCSCNTPVLASGNSLRTGHTKSCGCIRKGRPSNNRHGYGESTKKYLLASYKRGAKYRNIKFELTNEQFYNLCEQNCHYCGTSPVPQKSMKGYGFYVHNGVDRMEPEHMYSIDNCVTACSKCNYAKGDMGYEEFLKWIDQVHTHRKAK